MLRSPLRSRRPPDFLTSTVSIGHHELTARERERGCPPVAARPAPGRPVPLHQKPNVREKEEEDTNSPPSSSEGSLLSADARKDSPMMTPAFSACSDGLSGLRALLRIHGEERTPMRLRAPTQRPFALRVTAPPQGLPASAAALNAPECSPAESRRSRGGENRGVSPWCVQLGTCPAGEEAGAPRAAPSATPPGHPGPRAPAGGAAGSP